MSDYPMLISNKLHSFRNFSMQNYTFFGKWHQFTLKNVTQNSDFVRAKSGLLSE